MKKFFKHSIKIFGIVMLCGIPLWVPLALGTGFLFAKNKIMETFKNSQKFQNYQQQQTSKMQTLKQTLEKAEIDYLNHKITFEEFDDAKVSYEHCAFYVNSNDFVFDAMKSFDKQSFDDWTKYNGISTKSFVFGGTVGALIAIPYTVVICHKRVEVWKAEEQAQGKDPHLFDKIN